MKEEAGPDSPPVERSLSGESVAGTKRTRFSRASANLTLANVAFTAFALVTGPILARALGPAGRGDLAAILVPLTLIPAVALLGQDVFAARQAARGRPVGTLVLSVGALLVAIGAVAAVVGIPLSAALAGDRTVVRTFLLIGFATMPIVLITYVLLGINSGLERWRPVIAAQVIPALLILIALVALFATGSLTLTTAAAVYLVGALFAIVFVAPVLRHRRFRFDLGVVRESIPFGAKACVGTSADLANTRLDQLLMITLVAPQELGLYAVAANIGGFGTLVTGGVSPPLLQRISAGEVQLAPRALRTTLLALAALTLLVALSTPVLLAVLFGRDFMGALWPAWILLAAGMPLAGTAILTQTLNGVGRPGLPAMGQGAALVVTVPGLLLLLPPLGALGAALVSLAAYTLNFLIVLVATIRACRIPPSELLVPTRGDLGWLWGFLRSRLGTAKGEFQAPR